MKRTEVVFKEGSILRKEMLNEIYLYPKNFIESYYSSYGDGILFGLNWKNAEEGKHIITPGALKFNGAIYNQENSICVEDYFMKNLDMELKLDKQYRLFFIPEEVNIDEPNITHFVLKLTLIQSAQFEEVMEKGFYYSYVRMDGRKGLTKIEDNNYIYGLHAGYSKESYSISAEEMKRTIEPILDKKDNKHFLDYEILKCIYKGESVPAEFIMLYIKEYYKLENIQDKDLSIVFKEPKRLMQEFIKACNSLSIGYNKEIKVKDNITYESKKDTYNASGML